MPGSRAPTAKSHEEDGGDAQAKAEEGDTAEDVADRRHHEET